MTQFCSFLWLSNIAIARTWKQPKCPSTEEWIKKMWYIYRMEYCSILFCSSNPLPRVRGQKIQNSEAAVFSSSVLHSTLRSSLWETQRCFWRRICIRSAASGSHRAEGFYGMLQSLNSSRRNSEKMRGKWRRQWHPTPVLLPGKSHGQRSLVGCSPWGR